MWWWAGLVSSRPYRSLVLAWGAVQLWALWLWEFTVRRHGRYEYLAMSSSTGRVAANAALARRGLASSDVACMWRVGRLLVAARQYVHDDGGRIMAAHGEPVTRIRYTPGWLPADWLRPYTGRTKGYWTYRAWLMRRIHDAVNRVTFDMLGQVYDDVSGYVPPPTTPGGVMEQAIRDAVARTGRVGTITLEVQQDVQGVRSPVEAMREQVRQRLWEQTRLPASYIVQPDEPAQQERVWNHTADTCPGASCPAHGTVVYQGNDEGDPGAADMDDLLDRIAQGVTDWKEIRDA